MMPRRVGAGRWRGEFNSIPRRFVPFVSPRSLAIEALLTETIANLDLSVAIVTNKWDQLNIDENYRAQWINHLRERVRQVAEILTEDESDAVEKIRMTMNEWLPEISALRKKLNLAPFELSHCRPGSIQAFYAMRQELARLRSLSAACTSTTITTKDAANIAGPTSKCERS
uniref:ArsA_ATPase domain-containing protein n=1 Tax=Ascaris lumbricoides TaxID=6252 RepID=A0A0M3I2A3_ASCLU